MVKFILCKNVHVVVIRCWLKLFNTVHVDDIDIPGNWATFRSNSRRRYRMDVVDDISSD